MADKGEQTLPYALTSLERVKERMNIETDDNDPVLVRMINSATDFIEKECGARRFLQTKYVNEVYSSYGAKHKYVQLRQAPIFYLNITGAVTAGSNQITGCSSVQGIQVGMPIIGDGTPPGIQTTVTAITGTTLTISNNAVATAAVGGFTIHGLLSLQYRAGTPTSPSWIAFIPDQYELTGDGRTGLIRVYGWLPTIYENMIRATYIAGYPIYFPNAGDNATHQLPTQLSDLCESLVVRRFTRKDLAGKSAQIFQGSNISWRNDLDQDDLDIIDQFKRIPLYI